MSSTKKLSSLSPLNDAERSGSIKPSSPSKMSALPQHSSRDENLLGPIVSGAPQLKDQPAAVIHSTLGELKPLRNASNPFAKSDALRPITRQETDSLDVVSSGPTPLKPLSVEPATPADFDREKRTSVDYISMSDAINGGDVDKSTDKSQRKSTTNSSNGRDSDDDSSESDHNNSADEFKKDDIRNPLFKSASRVDYKAVDALHTHQISPSFFSKLLLIHKERVSSDPLKIAIANGDIVSVELVRINLIAMLFINYNLFVLLSHDYFLDAGTIRQQCTVRNIISGSVRTQLYSYLYSCDF